MEQSPSIALCKSTDESMQKHEDYEKAWKDLMQANGSFEKLDDEQKYVLPSGSKAFTLKRVCLPGVYSPRLAGR